MPLCERQILWKILCVFCEEATCSAEYTRLCVEVSLHVKGLYSRAFSPRSPFIIVLSATFMIQTDFDLVLLSLYLNRYSKHYLHDGTHTKHYTKTTLNIEFEYHLINRSE